MASMSGAAILFLINGLIMCIQFIVVNFMEAMFANFEVGGVGGVEIAR